MKELTPNSNDPWIVAEQRFNKRFFRYGPCWMTEADIEDGQVGQATRDVIRDRLLVELCTNQEIDFKTLQELLTEELS